MNSSPTDDSEITFDPKRHNVYANRIDGSWLHISEADSGKNDYYCQGCEKELVAVKSKLPNRMHFFRHAAMDVQIERRCVYRDIDFRHKLAVELLARLKHVKVPAVYKWPPKGMEGMANLIKEAELIEAHSVEVERAFYENEQGEIKWGSGQGVDEKFLLVRPDVVFFDAEKNPVLLVELAVSHKVDAEKTAKLRRLGINTIEILVPRDSPEAIEAALYTVKNTKWIYNYEEANAKYIPVPEGDSTGVSSADEQQRRLFAETFECRQAEVRNLIRSIARVLASKPYGDAVQQLGAEISRVEENTEEHRTRLDDLREKHRSAATHRHDERRAKIEREKAELEREETTFGEEQTDLGERYQNKNKKLRGEDQQVSLEQKIVDGELSGEDEDANGINEGSLRSKRDLELLIRSEEREIERIDKELEDAPGKYQSEEDELIERYRKIEESENGEISRIENEIEGLPGKLEKEEERIAAEFQSKTERLPGEFGTKESELEREFEDLRKNAHRAVMSRDGFGSTDIATRIRKLLEARRVLDDLGQTLGLHQRYKKAWRCFKEGTFENWPK